MKIQRSDSATWEFEHGADFGRLLEKFGFEPNLAVGSKKPDGHS